jgi:adenosyl cobinamide kinase/adenosyl cobinamide phosphate guanylyltransferase
VASTTDHPSSGPVASAGLVLLLGGARSGKSSLAVRWGRAHDGPVTFVATAEAGDHEMHDRIERHRAERPDTWDTIEEPRDIAGALTATDPNALVIVDCLTLWLANVLDRSDADILTAAGDLVTAARGRAAATIVVSNEVGWGIVPADPGTRRYRDLLGEINTRVTADAARTLVLVAGHALPLEPPPPSPFAEP